MAKIILRNTKIGGFWTPKLIPTVFWYDPSDDNTISTSGASVTGVADKSGNSYNLSLISSGISGPTIGTRTLNGLNVFEYPTLVPNSNTALENNNFSYNYTTTPLCISLILRCDEDFTVDQDFIFAGTDTTTPKRIAARISGDGNIQIFSFDSVPDPDVIKSIQTTVGLATDGKNLLITLKLNSPTSTIRLDGVQRASGDIGIVPMSFLSFGSNEDVQQNLDGFLAEIVGFSDPTKQEIVEGYLAHKWGLVDNLPNEHPYKNKNELYTTRKVILNSPVFWTPEEITTSLWLDAQDESTVILNGSSVSQWNDKSGNENNATQTTSTQQPLYQLNGISSKKSLLYNVSNHRLLLNFPIGITSEMSVFSVFRRETSGIWSWDIGCNNLNSRPHGLSWGTTNFIYNGLGLGNLNSTIFGNNTSIGNFIAQTYRSNITNRARVWLNGSQFGSLNREPLTLGGELVWVGHRFNQSHNGLLGEIIVINQEVSLETQRKMEGYLAHKWELTSSLPNDHPYKTEKPRI